MTSISLADSNDKLFVLVAVGNVIKAAAEIAFTRRAKAPYPVSSSQTRIDNGLPKRRLVSARHRRLGSVRTPAGEGDARAGRRRIARHLVQGLAKSAAEREHALLDDDGHFADVTNRFASIVENPRAPFDLRRERVDLGFVLFRLVL
jgi:hypothetical protein